MNDDQGSVRHVDGTWQVIWQGKALPALFSSESEALAHLRGMKAATDYLEGPKV